VLNVAPSKCSVEGGITTVFVPTVIVNPPAPIDFDWRFASSIAHLPFPSSPFTDDAANKDEFFFKTSFTLIFAAVNFSGVPPSPVKNATPASPFKSKPPLCTSLNVLAKVLASLFRSANVSR